MYKLTEGFWNNVVVWLNQQGINPIYLSAVISLLVVFSYRKEFNNWAETESWKKGLAASAVFGSVILVFSSILQLLGAL